MVRFPGPCKTPAEAAGGTLAEGAFTAPVLADMALNRKGVETPIAEAVADDHRRGRIGVREAVAALVLARPIRAER